MCNRKLFAFGKVKMSFSRKKIFSSLHECIRFSFLESPCQPCHLSLFSSPNERPFQMFSRYSFCQMITNQSFSLNLVKTFLGGLCTRGNASQSTPQLRRKYIIKVVTLNSHCHSPVGPLLVFYKATQRLVIFVVCQKCQIG